MKNIKTEPEIAAIFIPIPRARAVPINNSASIKSKSIITFPPIA